jgi:hypothetical protein
MESDLMCVEIDYEGIRAFAHFSREALPKPPSEERVARIPARGALDELAKTYIRMGCLAIRQFADAFEAGGMDLEEACVLWSRLVESELMLGQIIAEHAAAGQTGQSCIGQCSSEKKKCKNSCQQKHCGCTWDAFLCKINCFFTLNIGGVIE